MTLAHRYIAAHIDSHAATTSLSVASCSLLPDAVHLGSRVSSGGRKRISRLSLGAALQPTFSSAICCDGALGIILASSTPRPSIRIIGSSAGPMRSNRSSFNMWTRHARIHFFRLPPTFRPVLRCPTVKVYSSRKYVATFSPFALCSPVVRPRHVVAHPRRLVGLPAHTLQRAEGKHVITRGNTSPICVPCCTGIGGKSFQK